MHGSKRSTLVGAQLHVAQAQPPGTCGDSCVAASRDGRYSPFKADPHHAIQHLKLLV